MIVTGIAGCLATFPIPVSAQGISLVGVNEGGALLLPLGTATTNLAITATPANPSGPTNVVFTLERQGTTLFTLTSPPPYAVTFTNLPEGKYFLSAMLMAPGTPARGDLSFDIKPVTLRPANDDWSQAAVIPSLNVSVTASNTYATRESNEPAPGGAGSGKSIWWKWSAVSNGVVTATTAGSSFDTVLGVYTGTNLATLVAVGANDDAGPHPFSQVTFSATNGGVYYFAVDSTWAAGLGYAQLRLVAGSPPAISITSPPDGYLMLVTSAAVATNATAFVSSSDPTGIARMDYWFDGGTSMSRSGTLSAPYQLGLTNLFPGHYVLTLVASNHAGLISATNAGLSVISLEPMLVMEGLSSSPRKFQMGVTGFKGPTYALQASTNLEVWCGVKTWSNFAGAVKVADTNIAQSNRRFYRAASLPSTPNP